MRRKIATVLATVMTAVVLLMRVLLTPLMQDSETGQFHLSYWVIAVMALTVVAILILVLSDRRPVGVAARPMVLPVSMASVAAGAVLVVSTLFDLYIWVTTKPPMRMLSENSMPCCWSSPWPSAYWAEHSWCGSAFIGPHRAE